MRESRGQVPWLFHMEPVTDNQSLKAAWDTIGKDKNGNTINVEEVEIMVHGT